MLQLSERLQQNIAFVLRRSLELEEQAASSALSQPEKLTMLCYAASELALTALISSDELESLSLPREEQLLQREAASALRQIALHALDIQAWELPDAIRAELAAIRKHCETLAGCVELPPEPETPAPAPLVSAGQQAPAQVEAQDLVLFTPTTEEDEETRLSAQIRALRELLASLVQERDELVHVTCRELEARYYRELGSLEAEVFRADGLVNYYRRGPNICAPPGIGTKSRTSKKWSKCSAVCKETDHRSGKGAERAQRCHRTESAGAGSACQKRRPSGSGLS